MEDEDNVLPFKQKPPKEEIKETPLMNGASAGDQILECPCGSLYFNLRADFQVECGVCDGVTPFVYFDKRLL